MTEATVVNIDPNGDVFLELSDLDRNVRLLVSSKVLALVSPVFAAMFRSRFKEGLNNGPPPSEVPLIPLPEDDLEAFLVLCKVTHFQIKEVPKSLTSTCLEKFAIICDKYDCVGALKHSSTVWLHAALKTSAVEDFNKLLFAAYVLDIPDAFSRISWQIVLVQVGSFVFLPGLACPDIVTHDLSSMLNVCRTT